MRLRDLVLTLFVVTAWGVTFTVIKVGLTGVPPMLLAALRFLALLPVLFFVPRPIVPIHTFILYGLLVGVGQFGCLFYALDYGMPAGLSSLVLQSQAIFTLLLATKLLQERISLAQIIGIILAFFGLFLVGISIHQWEIIEIPLLAYLLTISGALFWGFSNILVRYAAAKASALGERLDMFHLVVWSSLVPPIPLFLLALRMNSTLELYEILSTLKISSIFAVLYLAFVGTLFGFGLWCHLLQSYQASQVAPLSLLVPITGLLTAWAVLGEQMLPMQWAGGFIIFMGLMVSVVGGSHRSLLKGKGSS